MEQKMVFGRCCVRVVERQGFFGDVLMCWWLDSHVKKLGRCVFTSKKWCDCLLVSVCVCWVLYFFLLRIWEYVYPCWEYVYINIYEHAQHRLELLATASSWSFYAQSFFEQNIRKSKWAGSNDIWIPHLSDIIVTSICKNGQIETTILRR